MADRIRGGRSNEAHLAERALEEIRRDGAFDNDPDFAHIIGHATKGFNKNDDPVYDQQQQQQRKSQTPRNSVYNPGGLE